MTEIGKNSNQEMVEVRGRRYTEETEAQGFHNRGESTRGLQTTRQRAAESAVLTTPPARSRIIMCVKIPAPTRGYV